MYRKRLRTKYSPEQLREIYQIPHNSSMWPDHKIRVRQTVSLGKEAVMPRTGGMIADLSCGNAIIPTVLATYFQATEFLGDIAPGYTYHGPIEETINALRPNVDLFICSETIEHLDDPDHVLAAIRQRSRQLLLSTPIAEKTTDNPEHYWGWDQKAVGEMLESAGWWPVLRTDLVFYRPDFCYDYQIWLCE